MAYESVLDPSSDSHAHAPTPVPASAPVSYAALLRIPAYRRLWLGHAISTAGSVCTRLAVPVVVFQLTGSYALLGLAVSAGVIGSLVFGMVMGALADRWNRRQLLIGTDLANALLLVLLVVALMQPVPINGRIALLCAVMFAAAALRELFGAARIALVPHLVPEHALLAANAFDQATSTIGELLSFPLTALVLVSGPTIAFGLDALSFLGSAVCLYGLPRIAQDAPTDASSVWQDIRIGWNIVASTPLLGKLLLLSALVPWSIMLMFTLQVPYAVDVAGSSAALGLPLLEAAMAVGFLLGVWLFGQRGQRANRAIVLAVGIMGMGLALLLQGIVPLVWQPPLSAGAFGVTPLLGIAALTAAAYGVANSVVPTCIRTMVQEHTPAAVIGRVASLIGVMASVGYALGALSAGLAEHRVPFVFALTGGVLLLLGLLCMRWLPASPSRQPV